MDARIDARNGVARSSSFVHQACLPSQRLIALITDRALGSAREALGVVA